MRFLWPNRARLVTAPTVVVRTMNKGRTNEFDRAFLYCPHGHEVGSAAVDHRLAVAWLAGDFSDERCGYGRCSWGREAS